MPRKDRAARNQYQREYNARNPGKRYANEVRMIQKSFESFIKHKFRSMIDVDARKNAMPDVDLDYLMNLFIKQEGRCAISGHVMTHMLNDIYSLSIDRIDSKLGHIKGNVQLVCLIMQYAKNKFDDKAIKQFIQTMPGVTCV